MDRNQSSLVDLIRTLHHMEHICMKNELMNRGLSELSNPKILFTLMTQQDSGALTQKEIADRIGTAAPTVAISLKRMERAGLVQKTVNQSDQRQNYITLTEKGRTLTHESIRAYESFYKNMLRDFSEEEKEQMRGYYRRMIDNVRNSDVGYPEYLWKKVDKC